MGRVRQATSAWAVPDGRKRRNALRHKRLGAVGDDAWQGANVRIPHGALRCKVLSSAHSLVPQGPMPFPHGMGTSTYLGGLNTCSASVKARSARYKDAPVLPIAHTCAHARSKHYASDYCTHVQHARAMQDSGQRACTHGHPAARQSTLPRPRDHPGAPLGRRRYSLPPAQKNVK